MRKKSSTLAETEKTLEKPKSKMENALRFTTGSLLLDLLVGGGEGLGFPAGRIVNFVGDKSSGKTFVACEMVAASYHASGRKMAFNYDDAENGFTFDTQKLWHVDVQAESKYQSKTVEQMDVHVKKFIDSLDGPGIYVVDSLDGLSNKEKRERESEREKKTDKGEEPVNSGSYQMGTPKFLSQDFFPSKADRIMETNALLVIVSQTRENIDPFSFQKWTRSGGKALDFYCHTVLWLGNVCKIKKTVDGEDRVVGVVIEARTEKSKTARPFRKVRFSLYFDYGIDDLGSQIDWLFGLRTDNGQLSAPACREIYWKGEKPTVTTVKAFMAEHGIEARGSLEVLIAKCKEEKSTYFSEKFGCPTNRAELLELLDNGENSDMRAELRRRVIEKWEAIEAAVKTERRSKYGN